MNGLQFTPDVCLVRPRFVEFGDFPTVCTVPTADKLTELLPSRMSAAEKERFRRETADVLRGRRAGGLLAVVDGEVQS